MDLSYTPYRRLIARCTIGILLIFLLCRWYEGAMLHQLAAPVLFDVNYGFTQWVMRWFSFHELFIARPSGSCLFTICLILAAIAAFVAPERRLFTGSFQLLYFVYATLLDIYSCHNMHYMYPAIIMLSAFTIARNADFDLWWCAMRYYICWIYGSAFCWKLYNGAFFSWNEGIMVVKTHLADYLYHFPGTVAASGYRFFIAHPVWVNAGHKIVVMMEGAFIAGFFTRRYDRYLVAFIPFIHLSAFIFADVFFAEWIVVVLPLLPPAFWLKLYRRFHARVIPPGKENHFSSGNAD